MLAIISRMVLFTPDGAMPSGAPSGGAALSARHVASILDANWDLAQEAKALAEAAAIDNGIIWDARRQVSREIV